MSKVSFRTASGERVAFRTKKRRKKKARPMSEHLRQRIRGATRYDVMPSVAHQRNIGYSRPLSEHRSFESAK